MKYPNIENSMPIRFLYFKKRLSQLLIILVSSFLISSPASAFISSHSAITSAKDLHFNILTSNSSYQEDPSDFSIALQSRILSLLAQQLLEKTDKKKPSSFLKTSISYKTNTFSVNIISNLDSKIRIEIHDHGVRPPKVLEVYAR